MLTKHSTLFSLFIIFLISLLFLTPIMKGFYLSHDSVTHVARTASYVKAFQAGQFPPRWAADLNYGYGSPFLIFYYPLPGYIMSSMYFLGIPLEMTYRIFAFLVFVGGPVAFYFWVKQKFSNTVALTTTVFYMCLPYRFLTLYVRGGVGEFLAFSLLPLWFYLLGRKEKDKTTVMLLGIITGLLILSHNAVSLLFIPIFIFFGLLQGKKVFLRGLLGTGLGLLLAAYFWLPALLEAKYTSPLFYFANWYKDHFVSIPSLFYSAWGFGPDINKPGGLSAQLGIAGSLVLLISLFYLLKQKTEKRFVFFWLAIACIGLFLSSHVSIALWEKIDFLKKFQFPWRFMVLPSFAAVALSPYLFRHLKHTWMLVGIASFCIALSLSYASVERYVSYPNSYYFSYPGSTYFHGEATTPWTQGDPSHKAFRQFEVLNGEDKLSNEIKRSTYHAVTTKSNSSVTLLDNTVYFPGWVAYVDKKLVAIQFQDINYKGFIEITVPKGEHRVEFLFEETKIRKIADWLSLGTFIGVLGFLCLFLITSA